MLLALKGIKASPMPNSGLLLLKKTRWIRNLVISLSLKNFSYLTDRDYGDPTELYRYRSNEFESTPVVINLCLKQYKGLASVAMLFVYHIYFLDPVNFQFE